ncbi:MAG: ATP-binding cassette domain-containing protein [Bacteroidetes bacterium]|nr:ATP-binding cassette domain-containing protein [Bacteroidota bacterium]
MTVSQVTKRFGSFTAVESLSFSISSGRIFGLLGPNGAGKTTTIRMIAGITIPDEGTITLNGQAIGAETQNRMGYLPEERGLYKKMKVLDGLQFLGELKNMNRAAARKTGADLLDQYGLSEWADKKIEDLSKGMQQKVQILSTIIHDPDFIILDEPLSGLDPINAELVNTLILDLKAKSRIILFSTHRMEQVEKICDDIVLVHHGKGLLNGSLRDIKNRFGRDSVTVSFEGNDGVFDTLSGVTIVDRTPRHVEMRLNGLSMQELIGRINPHLHIERIERTEPSLKDIFIQTVTEQGGDLPAEARP